MKLKTIIEHDEEVRRRYENKNLTGVACPNCEAELQYQDQRGVMLSCPPQKSVICFECNFQTSIYV